MTKELAKYETDSGEIVLTDKNIREVISTDPSVTDKEVMLFAALCKAHNLNPFIREAYLVKYGDKPATMLVGKEVFTKRAFRNPRFKGMQAGVMVMGQFEGRTYTKEREGSMVYPHEQLMGGWARVFIEGYEQPVYDSVSMSEYSTGKSNWSSKPATMIRKTALVHALREAFPEDFQGLYDAAEMGVDLPAAEAELEPVSSPEGVVERIPLYEEQAEQADQAAYAGGYEAMAAGMADQGEAF